MPNRMILPATLPYYLFISDIMSFPYEVVLLPLVSKPIVNMCTYIQLQILWLHSMIQYCEKV